jgi:Protein of unknown function (DUF1488)
MAGIQDFKTVRAKRKSLGVSQVQLAAKRALEKHDLTFPDQEQKFDFDSEVVFFFGQDGKTRIRCAISRESLDDDFRADDSEKVEAFRENRKVIEAARQKYLARDTETDGSILIHSGEQAKPRAARK